MVTAQKESSKFRSHAGPLHIPGEWVLRGSEMLHFLAVMWSFFNKNLLDVIWRSGVCLQICTLPPHHSAPLCWPSLTTPSHHPSLPYHSVTCPTTHPPSLVPHFHHTAASLTSTSTIWIPPKHDCTCTPQNLLSPLYLLPPQFTCFHHYSWAIPNLAHSGKGAHLQL